MNTFNGTQGKSGGLLSLWYRFTSPPEPPQNASFAQREIFRRGRTGSQISIVLFILIFISFPAAFAGSNSLLITILIVNLFITVLALMLNRVGQVNIAGVLVVISVITGPAINIITTPGGLNTSALPIFCLLAALPLMCAVSFLPPPWVFVVALIDCIFTVVVLTSLPSAGELHHVLQIALPGIVIPIVLAQVIVAFVAYITARNAKIAIMRANRAEEIAMLERREIERQEEEVEKKRRLDIAVEQILQVLTLASNGQDVQVPVDKEVNVLWKIGFALNNLLSRLRSYRQAEIELQRAQQQIYTLQATLQKRQDAPEMLTRTKKAASQLVEALQNGNVSTLSKSGTPVDEIVMALRGISAPQSSQQHNPIPSNYPPSTQAGYPQYPPAQQSSAQTGQSPHINRKTN